MVFANSGRDLSSHTLLQWLSLVQDQGIGEVLLTSIDKDGLSRGIDPLLIELARSHCKVPLIDGGGVKSSSDIADTFNLNCDGCAVASAFHFEDLNISDVKNDLAMKSIEMRRA